MIGSTNIPHAEEARRGRLEARGKPFRRAEASALRGVHMHGLAARQDQVSGDLARLAVAEPAGLDRGRERAVGGRAAAGVHHGGDGFRARPGLEIARHGHAVVDREPARGADRAGLETVGGTLEVGVLAGEHGGELQHQPVGPLVDALLRAGAAGVGHRHGFPEPRRALGRRLRERAGSRQRKRRGGEGHGDRPGGLFRMV